MTQAMKQIVAYSTLAEPKSDNFMTLKLWLGGWLGLVRMTTGTRELQ